jgi:rhodanese-related sulfurtransferase
MFAPQVPSVQATDLDPAAPVPAGSVLLDVREQDEWDAGHAPQALHIPLAELPDRVGELPEDVRAIVVCHSGGRSARATAWLTQGGYDAVNLDGGMIAWARAGLPVV